VWALRWGGRFWRTPNGPLFRIDPLTNRVAARIELPPEMVAFGVLASAKGAWVWGPSRVLRFDRAGRVLQEFGTDDRHGELTGAVLHAGGLLAATADGALLRFSDGGRTQVSAPDPALAAKELLTVAGNRVLATAGGTLLAADARTGRPLWRRQLGFRVSSALDTGGLVLAQGAALRDPGDRVWALDAATGRVLASATVPGFGTTSMTIAGGSLWIASSAGEVIVLPGFLTRLSLARAAGRLRTADGQPASTAARGDAGSS
jgi:outer membrane protein assembly factor BamB